MEGVDREGGEEADHRVRDGDAGEDEDTEAGQQDERGVEARAGGTEEVAGEAVGEQREGEDAESERDASGGG